MTTMDVVAMEIDQDRKVQANLDPFDVCFFALAIGFVNLFPCVVARCTGALPTLSALLVVAHLAVSSFTIDWVIAGPGQI